MTFGRHSFLTRGHTFVAMRESGITGKSMRVEGDLMESERGRRQGHEAGEVGCLDGVSWRCIDHRAVEQRSICTRRVNCVTHASS